MDNKMEEERASFSLKEVLELKKTMWDYCKKTMSGTPTEGEVAILPQMIQLYFDLFKG